MDGGGRLSRSVDQPGRRSDSVGIVVSKGLRARALGRTGRRAPNAPLRQSHSNRLIALIERLPRGTGMTATVAVLIGAITLGVVKGGHGEDVVTGLSDARNAAANAIGFRITSVAISGRKQLTQDEILAIGGINGRSSLLFLDAATVRDKLEADPWIREATVQKLYPGRLQIDVTERKPFALWQEDGRVSVIDEDGTVLEPYVARRFVSLPLVVGKGAASRASDFLKLLSNYPQVKSAVKAVVFVGERRWNLRLANKLDVRLPEHGLEDALAVLTKAEAEDHLFSRDITAIDLRLPDRLTVRLSAEAAKAREDMLNKDKKAKRKLGDA